MERLACDAIPQHRGFALVGNADGRDGCGINACLLQHIACDTDLALPYLLGIVFDPARLRKMLCEFSLRQRADVAVVIEQNRARAGRALIDGEDE